MPFKIKLSLIFSFLLILALPGPGWAKQYNLDLYTVDVPNGWNISSRDRVTTLVSPDRKAVFFITTGLSEARHRDKIEPQVARFDHITRSNPKQRTTLTRITQKRVVVTILGDHPDRRRIYYSIKPRNN